MSIVLSERAFALLAEFLWSQDTPECRALLRYWRRSKMLPDIQRDVSFLDCQGKFDKAGRWYPDESEQRECCKSIRPPSRRFPFSLLSHACTLKHCCLVDGASVTRVSRAKRLLDRLLIYGWSDYTPVAEALVQLGMDAKRAEEIALMLAVADAR